MTDTTKETTYEEKGHRVPENPKARKKSVNYTLAKIQKLVTEFETIKLDYANQKKTIKVANAKIKELEGTITKYKNRKTELEAQVKELQEIDYDFDELAEMRQQKANLEKQVSELSKFKKDLEKANALLESLETTEQDFDEI